jgi:hypothetical protein
LEVNYNHIKHHLHVKTQFVRVMAAGVEAEEATEVVVKRIVNSVEAPPSMNLSFL